MAKLPKSEITLALLADPIGTYKALQARIDAGGGMTPMKEFEPSVHFLKKGLQAPEVIEFCQNNAFAEGMRQLALNDLWHIGLDFEVSENTSSLLKNARLG